MVSQVFRTLLNRFPLEARPASITAQNELVLFSKSAVQYPAAECRVGSSVERPQRYSSDSSVLAK